MINATYESAEDFKDGYAIVKLEDGKYGVIDKVGKYIIQPEYTSIKRTQNKGIFRVYTSLNNWGYIGANEKFIWKPNGN